MENKALVPIQQGLVPFHGYNVLSVHLPDDHIAASHTALCRMLDLNRVGQIQRIRRDEELSEQLVLARVETTRGPRPMEVLMVEAIPRWVLGINFNLLAPEKRPLLIALKVEAVKIFYGYFFKARSQQAAQPTAENAPEPDDIWERLYQVIAGFEKEWQTTKADIASIKTRLTSLEERLEKTPPSAAGAARRAGDRLSPDHFLHLYVLARSLESRTGEPLGAVMRELAAAFQVADVGELPDSAWDGILAWFWQHGQR